MRTSPESMSTDVAVIGSGPGGAVTAMLCAEANRNVMLIEEGDNLPLESAAHFSREELIQKYRNAGINIALGSTKVVYVEGRCVGGGSEVNRGLYHRTPDGVLERWRTEFGVRDLAPDNLTPHFEACEGIAHVQYLPGQVPLISSRLAQGAANLGWACMEVPRLFAYAAAPGNASPGRKQSMTETFVPRFVRAGGRLMANSRVDRLKHEGGKWRITARNSNSGQIREISANYVFVACGAVQTPALLRRSGIRRNVGNSLRMHPMLKVIAVFDDEVNIPGELEPVHQIKQFDPRFSMGCSMSKRPALALAMASQQSHIKDIDRDWRKMAIYYVQSTGGRATVRNIPWFHDPLVRVQLGSQDMAELAEGLRRMCEVLFAAGAVRIYPCTPGYPILHSPADIAKLPETLDSDHANPTTMHLFSSCPMGENLERCATDSYGRVHGVERLSIADASLLCSPTVVNPQASVMAVAHRNALHIIDRGFR